MPARRAFLASLGGGWITGTLAGRTAASALPGRSTAAGAAAEDEAGFWRTVRGQFDLASNEIFFNCGTLGSCPREVRTRVVEAMQRFDAAPTYEYWARAMPRLGEIQAKAARLLGARDPTSVTFTHSTTEGINVVARGLDLRQGDEVVTTTHEHPGGDAIWRYLERKRGLRVIRYALPLVPPPDEELVSSLAKLFTPRTRLVAVSHIAYTTGLVLPVREIGRLAAERGVLYLVDGAHPVGQMRVDVEEMGCSFYAASGHKWLCAPRGTGLLYVRPRLLDSLEPYLVSYDWAEVPRDVGRIHQSALRLNFAWTNNLHDLLGLEAAIDAHLGLGPERVRARCMALWARFREAVAGVPGLEPIDVGGPARSAPMLTLRVRGRSNTELFRALKRAGITVKEVLDHELPEPVNAIRVSTHIFNSEEQVDALAAELGRLMSG